MHQESYISIYKYIALRVLNKLNYFGDESNLHGVGYVLSMKNIPLFKRIFWFIILFGCCWGAAGILQASLTLHKEGAVSYTVETNYLHWNTPFPAVTICEQIEADRVKSYLAIHNLSTSLATFYKEVGFWNAKYCRVCNNCQMNKTCVENIQELVENFRLNCEDILTQCWWNDERFSCCDRFHPIQTEYGTCFVFNSRLTGNESTYVVNRRLGLPDLVFTAKEAVSIRVHSPDDMVSVALENVLGGYGTLPLITDFEAILKAEQTISDVSIKSLPPAIRGCLFLHERPAYAHLWPFKRYSYSACVLYCRAMAQFDLCNCTHHFMPRIRSISICNIQGLACLNNNKESMANVECECPTACDEILYKTVHVFYTREHSTKVSEELIKRGSRGRVKLLQLPVLRVRRHAIRDTLGLVVDVGGVGGVFFGASLLSVIEIVYLLCIRRGPE